MARGGIARAKVSEAAQQVRDFHAVLATDLYRVTSAHRVEKIAWVGDDDTLWDYWWSPFGAGVSPAAEGLQGQGFELGSCSATDKIEPVARPDIFGRRGAGARR